MKLSLSNLATASLTAVCLALGGIVGWEASKRDKVTVTPPPPPKLETPAVPPGEFRLPPQEHYRNFVSRPLFIEGRTPLPEAAQEPESATASELSEFQLTGILDTPESGRIVLLRSRDGKRHYRLHPGDAIEGWHLAEIAPDHVVLQQGGRREVLQLRKPRPNPPVTPKRRRTARPPLRRDNPFLKKRLDNPFLKKNIKGKSS